MIRDFSKEELESDETVRDTELTLGGGTLLALVGGLLLLCVICFGLGYAIGHRSSPDQAASNLRPAPDSRPSITPVGSASKPGAAGTGPGGPPTLGNTAVAPTA